MILSDLELKKIREQLGLTQQELANKLGVNIRTVQKWEAGTSKIRSSTVYMINDLRKIGVNNPKLEESLKGINEAVALFGTPEKPLTEDEIRALIKTLFINIDQLRQHEDYKEFLRMELTRVIMIKKYGNK